MSSRLAPPLAPARALAWTRIGGLSGPFALLRANALYWPSVAPVVREQLAFWEGRALEIPDPLPRSLALGKLRAERFNPQLAATLATLAPRPHRRSVAEAIVALQVAYDYLDALTEQPHIPPSESERLHLDLIDAVTLDRQPSGEDAYLGELARAVNDRLALLPGVDALVEVAPRAALRCAQAQTRAHAAARHGDEPLEQWARERAGDGALAWPEWLAGAQASVLCLHALIAAAADERATHEQARQLDELYQSIGALTMLDSLIDREQDRGAGELGYIRHYEDGEQMGMRLAAVARRAAAQARTLPHAGHHLMTLTGVVAYYGSAPQARDPSARVVFEHVNAELRPLITATLAVMRAWRLAKRVGCLFGGMTYRGGREC